MYKFFMIYTKFIFLRKLQIASIKESVYTRSKINIFHGWVTVLYCYYSWQINHDQYPNVDALERRDRFWYNNRITARFFWLCPFIKNDNIHRKPYEYYVAKYRILLPTNVIT